MKFIVNHLEELKNSFQRKFNPRFNFHKRIGYFGESIALHYLLKNNYLLIDKNWRCSTGELDLICFDRRQYVFVEVKTRTESRFAETHLFATISVKKKQKLRQLSRHYFDTKLKNKAFIENSARIPPYRIDIIGIIIDRGLFTVKSIQHIRQAV